MAARHHRECGPGRHRPRQLPRGAGAQHPRVDHLEYPRSRFRHGVVGRGPGAIQDGLREHGNEILAGAPVASIDLWAVHPGGRTVLDAVERALDLPPAALAVSRDILRHYGNMSSATVMFVLEKLLRSGARGSTGCAMSFGPGLIAETMLFRTAA